MNTDKQKFETIYPVGRATGKTTREADSLVQELFNNVGEWIIVLDPDHRDDNFASRCLLDIVVNRLIREHRMLNVKKGLTYQIEKVNNSYSKIKLIVKE